MESENQKFNMSVFKGILNNTFRLSRMIWREKKFLVILIVFLFIIVSLSPFLQSGSLGMLINELIRVSENSDVSSNLILILLVLIISTALPPFLFNIQYYLAKIFWFFLEDKFEMLVIQKKGELDVATHEDPTHQNLFTKVNENGTYRVGNFVERQFFILQNIAEVVIASAIIIFSQWWVFIILFLGTLPELIIEAYYGKDVWSIYDGKAENRRRLWDMKYHFSKLSQIIELKLFQNIQYFASSIRELFLNFQKEQKIGERKKLINQVLALTFSQLFTSFAIVYFVIQVIQGHILVGTLTFILASIGSLRQALSGLFSNLGRQYQDSLFVTDVFKLIDLKPKIKNVKKGVKINDDIAPEIIFENVSFSYPGTSNLVLKDFSMKISSGEKLAIVGVNGAGKTTFVKLLCRFYDPTQGRILINGYDLREIDLESWYKQLGAIFQDYSHYHFLVKEAIAIGRTEKGTSLEKVKEAAQASEADIFIEDWEKGYEQMLGKEYSEGVEPSIGQWQKLALARTFYRDPKVLILDEPTSSIDAEAEAKIFDKLEALPKDRTVILISHRFSTVRQADKICVIEDGISKEFGSHEELLKLKGTYERLFNLQAKGYK